MAQANIPGEFLREYEEFLDRFRDEVTRPLGLARDDPRLDMLGRIIADATPWDSLSEFWKAIQNGDDDTMSEIMIQAMGDEYPRPHFDP